MKLYARHIFTVRFLYTLFSLSMGAEAAAQLPRFEAISASCGIEDVSDITDLHGNGVAAADFDKDGDVDFYLTTDLGIGDRLYRNNGRGQFEDVAFELGIRNWLSNRAALWFDYNGDRRLDLLTAGEACVNRSCRNPIRIYLYAQLPDGTFLDVTAESGITLGAAFDYLPFCSVGGLAAADFDQDAYLDLVLTVWGGGLKYFHNNGDGTFTDLTTEAGLDNEESLYWQCMTHDFNQDGKIDMYCNVDFNKNQLWINRGKVFENKAELYGLDNAFNEMGMTLGDYDNDGDLDVYATNITRTYQGTEQHNLLYENDRASGHIRFKEFSKSLGVSQSGWDWGATFIDIDNDGRQDLATTNGWNDVFWDRDQSKLWLNTLGGFVDVSDRCQFNDRLSATTLLAFDFDRDGDLDLLQSLKDNPETKKPVLIYENKLEETDKKNNYIVVKPRTPGGNHFAIGSQATIYAEDLISSRVITAGSSFYGQEPAEAFFGLGRREEIKEIVVKWPDNKVSIYRDLPLNQASVLNYEIINAPSNLTANTTAGNSQLSWQDNADNETGFLIHRSIDSLFQDYETFTVDAGISFYQDEDVASNTAYHYRVSAFNERVASQYSNIAYAIINEAPAPFISKGQETTIFPNPAVDEISISMSAAVVGSILIRLADRTGKILLNSTHRRAEPTNLLTERLSVPAGVYFLYIRTPESEVWQKVVVIR